MSASLLLTIYIIYLGSIILFFSSQIIPLCILFVLTSFFYAFFLTHFFNAFFSGDLDNLITEINNKKSDLKTVEERVKNVEENMGKNKINILKEQNKDLLIIEDKIKKEKNHLITLKSDISIINTDIDRLIKEKTKLLQENDKIENNLDQENEKYSALKVENIKKIDKFQLELMNIKKEITEKRNEITEKKSILREIDNLSESRRCHIEGVEFKISQLEVIGH